MEILNTYTFNNKTINVGDQFTIGEEYLLYVNEIFDIDGCVYLATSTNKDVMTIEGISINRNITSAELFITKNVHLFES
ncbi:hypothetical protein UFOVP384_7 [uncultured Caudovirales phage]|uniref:Uncharacterized protein n=1 Tax=uncultured Caudovirales phage TaxID=2100421 RepID=A0A6J7WYV1_9CAUD|nr:hypothetical protein UFOVP384_7 [uncultured Caudovirales phage]